MPSSHPIFIATRGSALALAQANAVLAKCRTAFPKLSFELKIIKTTGDKLQTASLAQEGGALPKGLFTKELEVALLKHRADLAVHSLKDMTSELPPSLVLACVPPREDPRDAFVSPKGFQLADIPRGATVGTASLRRTCQLLERRPDVKTVTLRGNVQTRLRKTEEQGLAGAILALAGLKRLGLADKVTQVLEPEVSLPAVGQGVLAIQCRRDDAELLALLARLEDEKTRGAVTAERAFLATLEGGCTVPLAGYATLDGKGLWLHGLVGSPDGTRVVRGERRGPVAQGDRLGRELGAELLDRGGREILAAFARPKNP